MLCSVFCSTNELFMNTDVVIVGHRYSDKRIIILAAPSRNSAVVVPSMA